MPCRAMSRFQRAHDPDRSGQLLADRTLGRAEWLARAETLELVTASAALAAAEVALADALG